MKRMMVRSVVLLALAAMHTAPAIAADVASPAAPAYHNWSGYYVGANIGYGWNNGNAKIGLDPDTGLQGLLGPAMGNHIPTSLSFDAKGALGGLLAGYNWQSGAMVYGTELDMSYANIHGSSISSAVGGGGYPAMMTTQNQSMNWFGTLRARIGYLATPALLAYITGGLAAGHVKSSTEVVVTEGTHCATSGLCSAGSIDKTRWGWTVGGGLEYALGNHWTIKGEYLFYDLGTAHYTTFTTAPVFPGFPSLRASTKFDGHIVRFGVSRYF